MGLDVVPQLFHHLAAAEGAGADGGGQRRAGLQRAGARGLGSFRGRGFLGNGFLGGSPGGACASSSCFSSNPGRLARRVLARALARLEGKAHFALLGVPGQARLEGAARAGADKAFQHVGLAAGQQLAHLLGRDGLLQDHLAALEVAAGRGLLRRGHAALAHIALAEGLDRAAALGAGAQAGLVRQIDDLAGLCRARFFAKVELELEVVVFLVADQRQFGGEGPAGLAAKALQRADAALAQKLLGLVDGEGAPARRFGEGKAAAFALAIRPGARIAAVVFAHDAAAVRAGRVQGGVVARHAVAAEFLGLLDDALGHGGDLAHEGLATELAFFHLRQLVFPLAGQLGLAEFFHLQPTQQCHQLKGLGRGDQLAAFAQQVFLADQPFDDGRARGRRAQALFLHGLAQLVVVDGLARAFHGAQQRGLAVTGGRARLQRLDLGGLVLHHFARAHRDQRFAAFAFLLLDLVVGLLAVDGQPARLDQHLAVALKFVVLALVMGRGDARCHLVFGARIEHRHEAAHHQVVQLALGLRQAAGLLQGGDDGEVVRHLAVVEDALAGPHVAVLQCLARVRGQVALVASGQHLEGLARHGQIVLGQVARVGAGVGQRLVLFVQALRQRQRGLGRKAEAPVGLALQAGQVVQQRAGLGAGLALFAYAAALALHGGGDGLRLRGLPQAVGAQLGVVGVLLPGGVEPLAHVAAGLGAKGGVHLPVAARHVAADLLLTLHHHRQRGRLHAAHGGQKEAPALRVEGRHGARAVDAHQPVGLAAAARRVVQAAHLRVAAQVLETVADGLRRHALQPQALHRLVQRLGPARILLDQAKDQLALAPGVAGVDQARHVLAPRLFDHRVQARLGLVHGFQVEVRRDHRQMGKAPLAAFHVVLLGRLDFDQVADRAGDHVGVALEMLVVLVELARHGREGAHDVLRDRGFFSNDQGLHGAL